ncbi:hypothetical protein [Cognatiluteimonas lumbrici]|uniref:hypothetical protein n=1 Tax=Cognatiluteimonas lumbrici TaxID=2559601 RepID=UPI00112CB418|nr:hypothetical protein [Luteimonas lumbrici]
MRTLINAMADTRPFPWNVVLVVGAGNGAQLPLLRRLEASRLLLVEPNPEQRELLARVVDPDRGEEVLDLAVTARDVPEVKLHLYSNPAFSSFEGATQLLEVLPNLEDAGEVSVPCKALHALVAEFGVDGTQHNLLVLDAPGQIELLADAPGVRAFSHIVVKAGSQPLYKGDPGREGLQASLAESGFELVGADPEAIYPFAVDAYRRNEARVELTRLRSELAAAQNRAKLVSGLKTELAAARASVSEEQARIAELERQAQALEEEKGRLVQELGQQSTQGEGAARQAEAQQKQLEHLKQRLNHLDEQLLNARDAMALAVRMQALRENDLEDLRKRYAELHGAHQSQRALLTKLSRRLVAANEYFQQLAGSGMLALEDAVVVESAPAPEKPRKRTATSRKPAAGKPAAKKPARKR